MITTLTSNKNHKVCKVNNAIINSGAFSLSDLLCDLSYDCIFKICMLKLYGFCMKFYLQKQAHYKTMLKSINMCKVFTSSNFIRILLVDDDVREHWVYFRL